MGPGGRICKSCGASWLSPQALIGGRCLICGADLVPADSTKESPSPAVVARCAAAAFNEGGLDAARPYLDPDVEFRPARPPRPGLESVRGLDRLEALVSAKEERYGPYRLEIETAAERGGELVVTGGLRSTTDSRFIARTRWSVQVRGNQIVSVVGHPSPEVGAAQP